MYPMAHALLKAVNDEALGFLAVSYLPEPGAKQLLLMVRSKSGRFTS